MKTYHFKMPLQAPKLPIQRTNLQNRSLHKGCQQIADLLIESGISLSVALRGLDVRPTMNSIKDVYRSIATAKFGVDSTADLTTTQINEVWVDLAKALEENTGVEIGFPSQENTDEYFNSLDTK